MSSELSASELERLLKRKIRVLLGIVIFVIVLSGVTAIPLETELKLLVNVSRFAASAEQPPLGGWLIKLRDALVATNAEYPFIAYGTDWLAFAHFVIGIAFIGPLRDPVKNIWVVEFGMIACVLVIPYALCMGQVREIPMAWRLFDCCFGLLGFLPLWLCRTMIRQLSGIWPE